MTRPTACADPDRAGRLAFFVGCAFGLPAALVLWLVLVFFVLKLAVLAVHR
jgi:hypothetical protein